MIGLLQMRPIPSHQTKGGGVAKWGGCYDFESLCFLFMTARVMLRSEEDGSE